ncbi:hypothetical protein BC834DRAFT_543602 [Gloeopeniophorella convolvens]|nr:hypothetical protein BC834DRAFT_543602 [Gloeopeniophorella convolvens]
MIIAQTPTSITMGPEPFILADAAPALSYGPLLTTAYVISPWALKALAGSQITKLFLSVREWLDFQEDYRPWFLPPTVTHLGIGTANRRHDISRSTKFFEWLNVCKDVAPGLRIVRLSNELGSADLAENSQPLMEDLAQLAERGVFVETAQGEVLGAVAIRLDIVDPSPFPLAEIPRDLFGNLDEPPERSSEWLRLLMSRVYERRAMRNTDPAGRG